MLMNDCMHVCDHMKYFSHMFLTEYEQIFPQKIEHYVLFGLWIIVIVSLCCNAMISAEHNVHCLNQQSRI